MNGAIYVRRNLRPIQLGVGIRDHCPCTSSRWVTGRVETRTLRWEETITHRVEASDAPELYDRINKGQGADVIGAIIHWSD